MIDKSILHDIADEIANHGDGVNLRADVAPAEDHEFIDVAWPDFHSLAANHADHKATFPSSVARYALREHGLIRTKAIAFHPDDPEALDDSLTLRVWFGSVDVQLR